MATPHVKRIKNELNKYDFYPTPYESTLSFLHAEFDGIPIPNFLEPAVGEGHIIKAIEFYSKERDNLDVITWLNDEQTDLFGEPTFYGYLKTWGDCEILGNIYENTELLNDQSK